MTECQQLVNETTGKHSGSAVREVHYYWRGEAKQKLGPHLLLCESHARQWNLLHPLGPLAVPISKKHKPRKA